MKKTKSVKKKGNGESALAPPSKTKMEERSDWREEMLDRIRALMKHADPDVIEEVKWRKPSNGMRGVPVWSHNGILCTGETYKSIVKMTFANGASLKDPAGLFNSSLEGNTRRAIDIEQGAKLNEKALKELFRAAVAFNTPVSAKQVTKKGKKSAAK